jgi:non-specific serine/threonine protein kinase
LRTTNSLIWQARSLVYREDYDQAERMLQEALAAVAAIPHPAVARGTAVRIQANLGVVAHERGDLATARARHEQALQACRELNDVLGAIRSLRDIGDVACDQNDYTAALAAYRECLALQGRWGDPFVVVNALVGSALVAAAWGQPKRAARLLGAADAAREQFRVGLNLPSERGVLERASALVRAAVGEPAFQDDRQAGRRLSLEAAIAEVQGVKPPSETSQRAGFFRALGISPREEDVLRLLVAGQSDRQIAATLFISVRTAEGHVARVLSKLGVRTRAEAIRAAIAAGFDESGSEGVSLPD